MTKSRPLLIAFLAAASAAQAQDPDISHQRQVYREINASAADLEKVSATLPGADGPVSLQGWKENGQLRKITASPGLSGAGFDEFYLEGGQPVFVFSTLKKDGGKAIEDRVYLENGEIVKWLSTDPSLVPHNLAVSRNGKVLGKTKVLTKGSASVTVDVSAGQYVFYCSVPGHRQAGMQGDLVVGG
jgi:hypothetical protein